MTNLSRERREEYAEWCDQEEHGVGYGWVGVHCEDLRALLQDSAWRERVEREAKELASRLEYCDHAVERQIVRPIGRELRAIVDTGDEEGA